MKVLAYKKSYFGTINGLYFLEENMPQREEGKPLLEDSVLNSDNMCWTYKRYLAHGSGWETFTSDSELACQLRSSSSVSLLQELTYLALQGHSVARRVVQFLDRGGKGSL